MGGAAKCSPARGDEVVAKGLGDAIQLRLFDLHHGDGGLLLDHGTVLDEVAPRSDEVARKREPVSQGYQQRAEFSDSLVG
mgnify:CR=1 FL=1